MGRFNTLKNKDASRGVEDSLISNADGTLAKESYPSLATVSRRFKHDPYLKYIQYGVSAYAQGKRAVRLVTQVDAESGDVALWTRVEKRVREASLDQLRSLGELPGIGVTDDSIENQVDEFTKRVLLVIRMVDVCHSAVMPMYLLQGVVLRLVRHFQLEEDLEIKFWLGTVDHNLFSGRFVWSSRASGSYNAKTIGELTRIKWAILESNMSISEAFSEISDIVKGAHLTPWETFFHATLLGRLLLFVALAVSATLTFQRGDPYDTAWAGVCAIAGCLVVIVDAKICYLQAADEFILAFVVGLVGEMARMIQRDGTWCTQAIIVGTLTWFFYGTAIVLGMMEVLDGWVVNGASRFWSAIVKTYALALGSALGTWLTDFWMDPAGNATSQCNQNGGASFNILYQIFLPVLALAAQGQVKVGHWQVLPTLVTQLTAFWTQVVLGEVANQNSIISNVAPSFAATLVAYCMVDIMRRRRPKYGYCSGCWNYTMLLAGANADVWTILFPAIYLLVPGSTIFRGAFSALLNGGEKGIQAFAGFLASIFTVGISIVIGLKLGVLMFKILGFIAHLLFGSRIRTRGVKRFGSKRFSGLSEDSSHTPTNIMSSGDPDVFNNSSVFSPFAAAAANTANAVNATLEGSLEGARSGTLASLITRGSHHLSAAVDPMDRFLDMELAPMNDCISQAVPMSQKMDMVQGKSGMHTGVGSSLPTVQESACEDVDYEKGRVVIDMVSQELPIGIAGSVHANGTGHGMSGFNASQLLNSTAAGTSINPGFRVSYQGRQPGSASDAGSNHGTADPSGHGGVGGGGGGDKGFQFSGKDSSVRSGAAGGGGGGVGSGGYRVSYSKEGSLRRGGLGGGSSGSNAAGGAAAAAAAACGSGVSNRVTGDSSNHSGVAFSDGASHRGARSGFGAGSTGVGAGSTGVGAGSTGVGPRNEDGMFPGSAGQAVPRCPSTRVSFEPKPSGSPTNRISFEKTSAGRPGLGTSPPMMSRLNTLLRKQLENAADGPPLEHPHPIPAAPAASDAGAANDNAEPPNLSSSPPNPQQNVIMRTFNRISTLLSPPDDATPAERPASDRADAAAQPVATLMDAAAADAGVASSPPNQQPLMTRIGTMLRGGGGEESSNITRTSIPDVQIQPPMPLLGRFGTMSRNIGGSAQGY